MVVMVLRNLPTGKQMLSDFVLTDLTYGSDIERTDSGYWFLMVYRCRINSPEPKRCAQLSWDYKDRPYRE
jgi:hypothetical protein